MEKAKVSIGLRANNSFAWMTKGVSEYHLFRFSDACESLNITKEALQSEGSGFHPQLEVALQESCKYSSGPQGPQKTSQFNHRELYAGTSKSYEDQLKAKIEYAEKCHEDLPGTNYYYDRCQGTAHRY